MNNSFIMLLKTIPAISVVVLLILVGFFCFRLVNANNETIETTQNSIGDAVDTAPPVSLNAEETAGQTLFNANCTSCHAISERVVGPALKDVHKRHSQDWLVNFIRNSPEMIRKGDPEAVRIYQTYNETSMTPFTNLSEKEIQSILMYIRKMSTP